MRRTRVFAGVTVLTMMLMVPSVAHADDPTSAPTTPTSSTPTLDVPDPLAISSTAITKLTTLALRYESNLALAEDLRTTAQEKTADARHQRALASAYVAQVVDYAMSPSGDPFAQKLTALAAADNPEDIITGIFSTEQVTAAQEAHLGEAKRAFDAAQVLQKRADKATKSAVKAEASAQRQLSQLGDLAEQLGLGASSTPDGLPQTRTEQESWNAAALTSWRAYTGKLKKLGVTAPRAARLTRQGGVTTATVGSTTVEVLPRETIRMVNTVLSRVGDDYAAKTGRDSWSCAGLVRVAKGYDLSGTPAQIYAKTVTIEAGDIRPGDLVFSATKASGIHHVGVYVGDGRMVDAAATRGQVGVSQVPDKPYAVTRPSLGRGQNTAPKGTEKVATTVCNASEPIAPTREAWTFPMKAGAYRISAGFGLSSSLWQTTHTGQDLSAPTGTPIYASRGGTVALQEVGWAGTLITVSHPDGTAERYAHASKVLVEDGQAVATGDEIALVGSRGNTTGPHLHFEIQVDGRFTDPMPVLVQSLTNRGAGTGWGGYSNGQVPQGVLCTVGGVLLRCDVAGRATSLSTAFQRRFGHALDLTSGYRNIVDQIQRGPEGTLVDIPGTSAFGWGTRFTVGSVSAAESTWLAKRAKKLGLTGQGAQTWSLGS